MMIPNQWNAQSHEEKLERFSSYTYIPSNRLGIREGHYRLPELARLLRKHARRPSVIRFLADMMD